MRLILTALFVFLAANFAMAADRVKNDRDDTVRVVIITGVDHPMAFVFNYGRGRVFHTPLGHDLKAITMPDESRLIRRGAAWAAGKL